MTPDIVHSIWKFIDSPEALGLSDAAPEQLVAHVLESLKYEINLAPDTELKVREYLLSRIPLISDILGESRLHSFSC